MSVDHEARRRYMHDYYLRNRAGRRRSDGAPSIPHKVWFGDRWERAQALKAEGKSYNEIAAALDLKPGQVRSKFEVEHYRHQTAIQGAAHRPSEDVLEDRDRRSMAPRDLTSSIFGDPPPGYSALDKKRSGASA